jgi:Holliday junction resolvase
MAGKKSKIESINDLNDAIKDCMIDILSIGSSSKGDNFDETVRDKLKKHLVGAKYIPTQLWCEKGSIYHSRNRLTTKYNFDFTGLEPLIDNGRELTLLIVDKPNGSQKWPDLLVVFDNVGLPIEIKSSREDKITWNSGLPRADSLYIYNCYGKSKTTCFLGQHAITDIELDVLKQSSIYASKFNQKHSTRWSYYVRDMNMSIQSYFENDNDKKKADDLEKLLLLNEDKLKQFGEFGNKGTLRKLKREIDEWSYKTVEFLDKYKKEQENRLFVEKETIDYLCSLTWDFKQKSDFDLGFEGENNPEIQVSNSINEQSPQRLKI